MNGVSRRIMACPIKSSVMAALRHFPHPSTKAKRTETNGMTSINFTYVSVASLPILQRLGREASDLSPHYVSDYVMDPI